MIFAQNMLLGKREETQEFKKYLGPNPSSDELILVLQVAKR